MQDRIEYLCYLFRDLLMLVVKCLVLSYVSYAITCSHPHSISVFLNSVFIFSQVTRLCHICTIEIFHVNQHARFYVWVFSQSQYLCVKELFVLIQDVVREAQRQVETGRQRPTESVTPPQTQLHAQLFSSSQCIYMKHFFSIFFSHHSLFCSLWVTITPNHEFGFS